MKATALYLFIFSFTLLSCCGQTNSKIKLVDVASFSKNIKTVKYAKILDVRTEKEFQENHIKNASNADIFASNFNKNITKLNKKKPVFVYCKSGSRSKKATEKLVTLGFENSYELDEGFIEWQNSGYDSTTE
jgi:rhodanese-related sulfurtransferase